MRVAYFCLAPGWSYHFVHELDLIEDDLEAGAEVHVVGPGRLLRYSDTRPSSDYRKGLRSDLRRFADGMSLLSREVTIHSLDRLARDSGSLPALESLHWPEFRDHEALNDFSFEGHDCGNAVLSSLISSTRDVKVDLHEHQDRIRRALESSIHVYLAARSFIETHEPDRVTVFNARMATFRGVLRACQQACVDCVVHERGATLDRVGLTWNTMPHDVDRLREEIIRHWPEGAAEEESAREIGRSFYQRKREKQVFNWTVFTEQQETGLLPEGLEKRKPVYSIFTISEYERAALPQYFRYLVHESQLQGILDIVEILKQRDFAGLLCIRIHPNSHDENPSLLEALKRELHEDFVVIVPADSPVDTYALIDASDKVITFGSTVSMEAAFSGKPSILLGTCEFQDIAVRRRRRASGAQPG